MCATMGFTGTVLISTTACSLDVARASALASAAGVEGELRVATGNGGGKVAATAAADGASIYTCGGGGGWGGPARTPLPLHPAHGRGAFHGALRWCWLLLCRVVVAR